MLLNLPKNFSIFLQKLIENLMNAIIVVDSIPNVVRIYVVSSVTNIINVLNAVAVVGIENFT
jgi:hypothetical protein